MKQLAPFFSQNPLDRLDQVRRDENEVKRLQSLPTTKFLLFFEGKLLVKGYQWAFSHKRLLLCDYDASEMVLLGVHKGEHYFCINVHTSPADLVSTSLRDFAEETDEEILGIFAQATSVLSWHHSHQHCASCGSKTLIAHAGWRRDCEVCEKQHFPRTDPVVIMLVTYEDECLLGRGVNFPEGRYSCLAGYMESGESIEAASRRELFEEAGIIGGEVSYIASQPWPFPSTLMIGVHVKAKTREITLDTEEIAEARWVHKEDIKAILNGDESYGISTPRHIAIARNLLEYWVS